MENLRIWKKWFRRWRRDFFEVYERDFIDTFGSHFWGFKTPKGTRFFVNGVYEWNAVFLEYDDGEDGDRVFLEDCDNEDEVFRMLCAEIENDEADKETNNKELMNA